MLVPWECYRQKVFFSLPALLARGFAEVVALIVAGERKLAASYMLHLSVAPVSTVFGTLANLVHATFNIFVFYSFYLFVCFIHEGGHWMGATLCGFRVTEFRIGILRWLPESGWRVVWRWRYLLSGWVRSLPTGYDHSLRLRFLTFVLSGPIASISAGLLGFALVRTLNLTGGPMAVLGISSIGSLFVGFANLLPFEKRGLRSDGAKTLDTLFTRRFRKLRFQTCFIDSKDELMDALRERDFARANAIAQAVLALSIEMPSSDAMVQALENVRALSDQGTRATRNAGPVELSLDQ